MTDGEGLATSRVRREAAASRYKPESVDLLLVAEAPPANLNHYFYFESVPVHDSLFRQLTRSVLGLEPTRKNKAELLRLLAQEGVFLIELKQEPVIFGNRDDLAAYVGDLVARCQKLRPRWIILLSASVYDVAFAPLSAAGLPVVDARIPAPSPRRLNEFRQKFGEALGQLGRLRREPPVPPELRTAVEPVPLISSARLAALLGVPRQRLQGLYNSDSLPDPVRLGQRRLWRPNELRDWIRAGRPRRSEWNLEADGTWRAYPGLAGRPYPLTSKAGSAPMSGDMQPRGDPALPDAPLLVDADKVAALLGIAKSSLWRLLSQELVPRPIRLGRRVLWSVEEIREWVRAGCPNQSRWEALTADRRPSTPTSKATGRK